MGICGGKPDAKPAEAASPGRARSKTSLDRTVQGAIQIFNTKSGHHVLSYMSEHDMIEATDSIAVCPYRICTQNRTARLPLDCATARKIFTGEFRSRYCPRW
jgi:hypothetical protein